jgi:methionine-rich copper-binding protein CopC
MPTLNKKFALGVNDNSIKFVCSVLEAPDGPGDNPALEDPQSNLVNLSIFDQSTNSRVAGPMPMTRVRAGVYHGNWRILSAEVRRGTAQTGAAGNITLDASASATNDYYKGMTIKIISGSGSGQAQVCSGYNGSTKLASVLVNWATNPDSSSVFSILPAVMIKAGTYYAVYNAVAADGSPARSLRDETVFDLV